MSTGPIPITIRKTELPPTNPPFTATLWGPQMCGAPQRLHHPRWTGGTGTHPGTVPRKLKLLSPFPPLNQERDQLASQRPLLHAHLCSAPPESGLELLSLCNKLPSAARHQPLGVACPFHALAALPALGIFFLFSLPPRSVLNVQMPQLLKIQPGGVGSVLEHAQAVCSVRACC